MSLTIKIGSRKSRLALFQSEVVRSKIESLGFKAIIVTFDTKGDQKLDVALHKIGDKGLFTAELEAALLTGEIDFAVHSLKDLPTQEQNNLKVAALLKREDPSDCLIMNDELDGIKGVEDLPLNAKVGTSSLRRIIQLQQIRPDLSFHPLRGNIETRIAKIKSGEGSICAGVLATAGLKRLNLLESSKALPLSPTKFIPAAGQGAIAVQGNQNLYNQRTDLMQCLQELNSEECEKMVTCERTVLKAIEGGCQTPFGAYAESTSEGIKILTIIGSPDLKSIYCREKILTLGDEVREAFELGLELKRLINLSG
jgi:hydroxymethylbilane synthase